jgi:DNA-binding NtrC family response regulator
VLLVEDDAQIRAVARGILSRHGYDVIEAQTAAAALRLASERDTPIHLLLTDVVMPQMSGKQLADRLGPQYPHMKILFMSGYTDGALEGQLPPGVGFLQKPFTLTSLTRKVRELLDG